MYAKIAEEIEHSVTAACWQQWRLLRGEGRAMEGRVTRGVVDPEALVLTSLCLRSVERRFDDAMLWWARRGAHLMSVQRLRSMRALLPASALGDGVEWFAHAAASAGDARWKAIAEGFEPAQALRSGKGPDTLELFEPALLMLRLRAGFGVGAKADFLTYLIAARATWPEIGIWTTSGHIAAAIHYSPASITRAGSDMALSALVTQHDGRPARYELDLEAWAHLLGFDRAPDGERRAWEVRDPASMAAFPVWRDWGNLLPFLMASWALARRTLDDDLPPVVSASFARDLVEEFSSMLITQGFHVPDARRFAGERYAEGFATLLAQCCAAVEDR